MSRRGGAAAPAVAAFVALLLFAGGLLAWPVVGPSVASGMSEVQQLLVGYGGHPSSGDTGTPEGTEDPGGADAGATEQSSPLLDAIRGPLQPPSQPPDLSGQTGASDAAAAAARSSLKHKLGGAEIALQPLYRPSADGAALTSALTAGAAGPEIVTSATNQVVVRLNSAFDHASNVLGAAVVAESLTRLEAQPLGAPSAGAAVMRQFDGQFSGAWLAWGGKPEVVAVLTLNSDTFGTFGLDRDGRLRPVVDLTYARNGSYRVPVDSGGVEATVWHELGHAVLALAQRLHALDHSSWTTGAATIEARLRAVVDAELGAGTWDARATGVSRYAATNVAELVAECFAEYLGSQSPRPFARTVVAETLSAIRGATPATAGPFLR